MRSINWMRCMPVVGFSSPSWAYCSLGTSTRLVVFFGYVQIRCEYSMQHVLVSRGVLPRHVGCCLLLAALPTLFIALCRKPLFVSSAP